MATSKRRGFTLIELLIVLAIISILSSVILVNAQRVRERGNDTARLANLNAIRVALRVYAEANGHYPITECSGGWTWVGYGGLWSAHQGCLTLNGPPWSGQLGWMLKPYISQSITDPTSAMLASGPNPDAGYLYIGDGVSYCLMAYKVPQNMLDFPQSTWNQNTPSGHACGTVTSAGQCASGLNSVFYSVVDPSDPNYNPAWGWDTGC